MRNSCVDHPNLDGRLVIGGVMLKFIFYFMILCLFSTNSFAFSLSDIFTSNEERVQRGKQYYEEQNFSEAVKLFQEEVGSLLWTSQRQN